MIVATAQYVECIRNLDKHSSGLDNAHKWMLINSIALRSGCVVDPIDSMAQSGDTEMLGEYSFL